MTLKTIVSAALGAALGAGAAAGGNPADAAGEITYQDYLRPAAEFLRFVPQTLDNPPLHPELEYYGTGGSGHWAVQCSLQVMSGLAILSTLPDAELKAAGAAWTSAQLREKALKMLRYALHTHVTGDLDCTDGKKWGNTWISVLGLERAAGGIEILLPHLTPDDQVRLRELMVHEADFRLHDYVIQAGLSKGNMPESNIWNAATMLRTAIMYPQLPQASAYVEKAKKMLLNSLTNPQDAGEKWYVGPNFTENWALDHHGYLNVGYMYECFSNLAFLYFWYRDRGLEIPEEIRHNVDKLWAACKRFTFPDGRLCRIGGDTRARWTYCQIFAVQAWAFIAQILGDTDAPGFERGYLPRVVREQAENGDGSFFGKRLRNIREKSWYYYTRIEADAFLTVTYGLHWHRKYQFPQATAAAIPPGGETWGEPYHCASFIRTPQSYRSVVYRAAGGWDQRLVVPNILCVPSGASDMAEWAGNLCGRIGVYRENDCWNGWLPDWPRDFARREFFKDDYGQGFREDFVCPVYECKPVGEGVDKHRVATRDLRTQALSDGATMVIAEKTTMDIAADLYYGFSAGRLLIPNDVQNGHTRTFKGETYQAVLDTPPAQDTVIDTAGRILTVDDKLSIIAVQGGNLKIRRTAQPQATFSHPAFTASLASERAEEIIIDGRFTPFRPKAGTVLYDVVYIVSACDRATAQKIAASVKWDTLNGSLTLNGVDGHARTVTLKR